MQGAVADRAGDMAALVGLDVSVVQAICERAAEGQVVSPANLNSADQIVIAGNREAVERAVVLAKEARARMAVLLKVSAPFHSALLKSAEHRLSADLDPWGFADLSYSPVPNVDATAARTGIGARNPL